MNKVEFEQVESGEQKEQAGILIREYLEWLNERVKRDYGLEFDVNAMIESDLSDLRKFHPPDGHFYLAQYDKAIAGKVNVVAISGVLLQRAIRNKR